MYRDIEKLEDITNIIVTTKNHTYVIIPDGPNGKMEFSSDYDLEPSGQYMMVKNKKSVDITLGFDKFLKIDNRENYND